MAGSAAQLNAGTAMPAQLVDWVKAEVNVHQRPIKWENTFIAPRANPTVTTINNTHRTTFSDTTDSRYIRPFGMSNNILQSSHTKSLMRPKTSLTSMRLASKFHIPWRKGRVLRQRLPPHLGQIVSNRFRGIVSMFPFRLFLTLAMGGENPGISPKVHTGYWNAETGA